MCVPLLFAKVVCGVSPAEKAMMSLINDRINSGGIVRGSCAERSTHANSETMVISHGIKSG